MAAKKTKPVVVTIEFKSISVEVPQTTITGKTMDEVLDQLKTLMLESIRDTKINIA